MGNWFSHIAEIEPKGMFISAKVIDASKEGDVWILLYRIKPDDQAFSAQRAHCSIVIDCAGESTPTTIHGLEVHLLVKDLDKGDQRAAFEVRFVEREHDRLYGFIYLGKIKNEFHSGDPVGWAAGLIGVCHKWFQELVSRSNTDLWSSSLNCQQYSRYIATKLGLNWPQDVPTIGDDLPFLIDVATWAIANANRFS